jgi:hypothetical protein
MPCDSCGGSGGLDYGYRGNTCRQDIPYPSISPESVPSLITNLVTALYGGFCQTNIPVAGACIQKAIVNGSVVWIIPCDPNNSTSLVGIPRLPGEGLMCYLLRIFTIYNPYDYVTLSGVQTVSNKRMNNTTFQGLLDFGATTPFGGNWGAIPIPNLLGSVIGSIPYQSAANITTQLAPGTTGYALITQGAGNAPTWGAVIDLNSVQTILNKTLGNTTFQNTVNFATSQPTGGDWSQIAITNLKGSVIGSIPYQSAIDTTTQLPPGTAGYVLSSNGVGNPPSWIVNSTVSASANNIIGGAAGQILYQSAGSTTSFIIAGTTGQVLISNGTNSPSWSNSVNLSNNIAGGSSNNLVYQSGNNSTTFLPAGTTGQVLTTQSNNTPAWSNSVNLANNISGGVAGSLPYQSAVGTTRFTTAGTVGQVLISNGANAPTWSNGSSWRNLITNPSFSVDSYNEGSPFTCNVAPDFIKSGFVMDTWIGGSTSGYTGSYIYQRSRYFPSGVIISVDADRGLIIKYNSNTTAFAAHVEQYIEGLTPYLIWSQNNQPQNMVLSFVFNTLANSASTTSISWKIEGTNMGDNWTSAATRTTLASGTIPSSSITTNTYQRFTIPFSIGSYQPGNGFHVALIINNINYTANSNYFIDQIQLEFGTTATPFEIQPYGVMYSQVSRYSQVVDYKEFSYANYSLGDRVIGFGFLNYNQELWNIPNIYLPGGMTSAGVNNIAIDFTTINGFSLQAQLNTNYTGVCWISTTAVVRPPIRVFAELINDANPITNSSSDTPVLPTGYTYKWSRNLLDTTQPNTPVRIHPDGSMMFIAMRDNNPVYQSFLSWKQQYELLGNTIEFYN